VAPFFLLASSVPQNVFFEVGGRCVTDCLLKRDGVVGRVLMLFRGITGKLKSILWLLPYERRWVVSNSLILVIFFSFLSDFEGYIKLAFGVSL
jgi:hypothetical protein